MHPSTGKPFRATVWFEGVTMDDLRRFYSAEDLSLIAKSVAYPILYANLPPTLRRNHVFFSEQVIQGGVALEG